MNLSAEIEINMFFDRVIELHNPNYLQKWMKGFVSYELISGAFGQVGARSIYKFRSGKMTTVLYETIIENNFPDFVIASYLSKNLFYIEKIKFTSISDNKTKYNIEMDLQFEGKMRLYGPLFFWVYKFEMNKRIKDFKNFVEKTG